MKIYVKRTETFIPEWNNNKSLPVEEQISVEFSYLTVQEKEEMFAKDSGNESTGSIARKVFLNNVKKINNLVIDVEGEIVPATPENILGLPDFFELYSEVATHIFTASSLSSEAKKK